MILKILLLYATVITKSFIKHSREIMCFYECIKQRVHKQNQINIGIQITNDKNSFCLQWHGNYKQ